MDHSQKTLCLVLGGFLFAIQLTSVLTSTEKYSHLQFAVQCVTLISMKIKGQL